MVPAPVGSTAALASTDLGKVTLTSAGGWPAYRPTALSHSTCHCTAGVDGGAKGGAASRPPLPAAGPAAAHSPCTRGRPVPCQPITACLPISRPRSDSQQSAKCLGCSACSDCSDCSDCSACSPTELLSPHADAGQRPRPCTRGTSGADARRRAPTTKHACHPRRPGRRSRPCDRTCEHDGVCEHDRACEHDGVWTRRWRTRNPLALEARRAS